MRPDPKVVQIPAGMDCRGPVDTIGNKPPEWFREFMTDYWKAVNSKQLNDTDGE